MPTKLYHASKEPLPPDLVLEPRYLNRRQEPRTFDIMNSAMREGPAAIKGVLLADALIAAYDKRQENMARVLLECVFERERQSHSPDRPSRLRQAIFLCPTAEEAAKFQKRCPDWRYLYVCKVDGTTFEADLTFIERLPFVLPIDTHLATLAARARQYWSGERTAEPISEILTAGTVTILELAASD